MRAKAMTHFAAVQAREQMRQGILQPSSLLQLSLDRIQQTEHKIRAWQSLAAESAQVQALRLDQQVLGADASNNFPLLGIPVAVKDIFATTDQPTTWGTVIYQEHYLPEDAAVVARLRSAGAIILGKTVTTEFATAAAGPTRNPHHLAHTPGGSSSGSAAAVAAGMVPIAIGSQTMGSILRPASYCGVFGFKPSFGVISRYGMMPVSPALDHVGWFARSLDDLELLLQTLAFPDARDSACVNVLPNPDHQGTSWSAPKIAFVLGPHSNQLEPQARDRLQTVRDLLQTAGATVETASLPALFQRAWADTQTLCAWGLATYHGAVIRHHRKQMSELLLAWIARGEQVDQKTYSAIRQRSVAYRLALSAMFAEYDAILTPVTTGSAPYGLDHTGSPIFCGPWTLCGVPTLNLPVGKDSCGLPLGCQFVGKFLGDYELLDLARWCWSELTRTFGNIGL
jgi:Asp-tRNA(Asn)/Glu-tRNA(Gln) amidotransferase A subunit family amidase